MTTRTFCTILSTNYLPKALALAESLRRHEDGARLQILFIDLAHDDGLPQLEGVVCLSTAVLGLPERTVLELAMSYDLVEFATAIKPLLFKRLLGDADQVFYLDPDTYVVSPMAELSPALEASEGGILLTPHFLRPPPRDAEITDGHMLLVGVNNLGFGGFDRRSSDMLDWWWGHLRTECLYDPLAGLFVDQKWMDIGATLFQAASFRHAGYNVGVANLSERPLAQDADGYYIASNGDRLRLFHFHAFDSSTPEKLSVRFRHTNGERADGRECGAPAVQGVRRHPRRVRAEPPAGRAVPVLVRHPGAADLAPTAPGLRPGGADRLRARSPRLSSRPRRMPTNAGAAKPGGRSPGGCWARRPSASASWSPRPTSRCASGSRS